MWESVFPLGIRIATGLAAFAMTEVIWRDGRVVEGSGLENRRYASIRGFESHSLRQKEMHPLWVHFLFRHGYL